MARKSDKIRQNEAVKRLKTLRSIYGKPNSLRKRLGLKRRKLSGSQKLLRLLTQ